MLNLKEITDAMRLIFEANKNVWRGSLETHTRIVFLPTNGAYLIWPRRFDKAVQAQADGAAPQEAT